MSNKEELKAIYAAFARGDIPYIIERVADDSNWNMAKGAPYSGAFKGKEEILGFFQSLGSTVDFPQFEPFQYVEEGDFIVSFINVTVKNKSNEKVVSFVVVHRFTFKEGKITELFETADSLAYSSIF